MLTLTARREPKDERDIARRAHRLPQQIPRPGQHPHHASRRRDRRGALRSMQHWHIGAFSAMNNIIFVLFLAEIAKLASQLVLYRRAA